MPEDDAIRAAAMSALVQKGLLSIASEVGLAAPGTTANGAELLRAGEQLGRAQRDVIEPATTDARFAANLAALRSRAGMYANLADEVDRAWREACGGITLHRASDGNLLARTSASDGRRVWVPAALDFANSAEALQGQEAWRGRMMLPFLIEGVGGGYLLPRLYEATKDLCVGYSPPIYLVERNLRALAVVLRLHDWSALLGDARVYVTAGAAAWEQWQQILRQNPELTLPSGATVLQAWPGSPPSPASAVIEEMAREREAICEELAGRMEAVFAPADRAYWARRYAAAGGDDPLRVLAVTCRYTTFLQHSTRDLLSAFERSGARTKLLIESNDHSMLPRRTYLQAFVEYRPDLVMVLDHHRQEMPDRYPRNVPYACWIQDELTTLFDPNVGSRMHEFDFTIGYARSRCVVMCGYPADQFMPCRLAVDPEKFAPRPDEEVDPSLRCDVVYVSNQSEPLDLLHERLRRGIQHPQVQVLLDAFYDQTRDLMRGPRFNGGYDLDVLLRAVEQKAGLILRDEGMRNRLMGVYVRPMADRAIRHATLEWVADWADATGRTLHLWGRGWENHPRFARYARGVAEHGRQLGRIARHAAINLHSGTTQALHQRVLEVVAAGGFLMVRRHPLDFPPPEHESYMRYLAEHNINQPARIPIGDLPSGWVEGRRRRDEMIGRTTPDSIEVTPEFLVEHDPRYEEPLRFRFPAVAFPNFESMTFDGPETFARRAEHFLAHPEEREVMVRGMQASVREMFTYDALASRILAFVRGRLGG